MPHKISWKVDKRVLLLEYDGYVDKDELAQLNTELQGYLDYGEKPVHIISDNTKMTKLDISLRGIRENMSVLRSGSLGWLLVIGSDTLTTYFAQTITSIFRLKLRMVSDVDEAYRVLQKEDATLPEKMLP